MTNRIIIYFFFAILLVFSCGKDEQPLNKIEEEKKAEADIILPLKLDDVIGRWNVKYSGNFGYDFRIFRNFKAIIIINLNTQSFVFKGVWTLDGPNRMKINIFEIKTDPNPLTPNIYSGFVKANASYFLFFAYRNDKPGEKNIILKPEKIIIDSNSSDGYFEPVIKLKKIG